MRVGVEVGVLGPARAGVARYVWNMIQEIMTEARDIEFVFYAPWPVDIPLSAGKWRLREPAGRFRRIFELWVQHDLPRLLADDGIDVFWGQGYVMPCHSFGRCARLLTIHDLTSKVLPESMELHTRLSYGALLSKAARTADRVVVDSRATRRLVQLLLGVPDELISVVYLGVDPQIRALDKQIASALIAERFGITGDFVLCVGTVEPRKNVAVLLDAVGHLDRPPLLVLAGAAGWRCEGIAAAIRAKESGGGVKYLGSVTDGELAALYSAATLMVYPSVYEGFGLPVLEAMACGCPVLCSWTSSLPEVGGSAARYFTPSDPKDLAAKISTLFRSPSDLAMMAREGLERAREFSFAKAAREMLALWHSMTHGRSLSGLQRGRN